MIQNSNKEKFYLDENSKFNTLMNDFNKIKQECINNSIGIKLFDESKATIIKTLFAYYYNYPVNIEIGIFDSILKYLQKISGLTESHYEKLTEISKDNLLKEEKKNKILEFINESKDIICNQTELTRNEIKANKTIFKTFLRYLAVYISKMTDNYASQKYKKIVNAKYIPKVE
jgi:dGTP triphosphohydrolase